MDEFLLSAINGFAGKSDFWDSAILFVSASYFFKGLIPVTLLWFLWFLTDREDNKRRAQIIATGLTSCVAIFVGIALALSLPKKLRPIHDPDAVNIVNIPIDMPTRALEGMSSMPSDHAVMFFSLAVGTLMWNRTVGSLLLIQAFLIVSLPRVYLGLHWPADIVVGAIAGSLGAFLLVPLLTKAIEPIIAKDHGRVLAAFGMTLGFLVTFQIASMFESARALAGAFLAIFT